jgi:hypothetical protein
MKKADKWWAQTFREFPIGTLLRVKDVEESSWEDEGLGDYCVVVAHHPTFEQVTLLFAKTGKEMVWDVVGMFEIFEKVETTDYDD